MSDIVPIPDEIARRILKVLLQRLASVGQAEVATALNVSESTVSRMKEDMPRFATMIRRLGLKVVPAEMRCYDEPTISTILTLAKQRMAQIETTQQLAQDWEEQA